ncbi:MAG: DNA repair protein RadA [Corynebacterium sp.]|uniref:DNA repair protein RadA n=1 Tax=unclassified Corynebacterium TaxID=2624378 RepID=UPI00264A2834|nr:DNA repair protein RadA [Corynebacterium sp.]MDN5582522.1 DNA repair protein RadA [Corynebacterium sp.]MDN5719685.1 DNA repair protein RadA [Corynebacterium sp.]MDN6259295.1 DNA repair protein RadA [Corynebacterium sp.]MDN6325160.1 DNA repair protein RadA [Corynebacterium sp.]MDN6510487.1 DNA repair protein RadA [Corynebacterium sp.]
MATKTAPKKSRSTYACTSCGHQVSKWVGRCPSCQEWGTMDAVFPAGGGAGGTGGARATGLTPTSPAKAVTDIDPTIANHRPSGIGELDRVLGGGVVPGSAVLLAGEPGVGKSTLLLEVANRWARQDRSVLYITAEESVGQVRHRAERTGALSDSLFLAAEHDLETALGQIDAVQPELVIVDSLQTLNASGVEGVAGGVAQTRAVAATLTTLAKSTGVPVLLVGHVTKDGNVAGPRTVEHLVDAVLNFEGDRHSSLRFLRGQKNRFGATDEVGCFEQTAEGIREVADPSGLFLHHRDDPVAGTAVTVLMDGRRPMLGEIQTLALETQMHTPRRVVTGIDASRVAVVLAVLAKRAGVDLMGHEVYAATVGGMKINEPGADLALALAMASTASGTALPTGLVAVGEVGLGGEVRRVPDLRQRLAEARRLGFTTAVVPDSTRGSDRATPPKGLKIIAVGTVQEAVAKIGVMRG